MKSVLSNQKYKSESVLVHEELPQWVRDAVAQRERAAEIALKKVQEKAEAVKKASGKWPHESLVAIASAVYMEQALGRSVSVLMIGMKGYYEMAKTLEAEDIEQGNFYMSMDRHKFTLYCNPDLPPFSVAIPSTDFMKKSFFTQAVQGLVLCHQHNLLRDCIEMGGWDDHHLEGDDAALPVDPALFAIADRTLDALWQLDPDERFDANEAALDILSAMEPGSVTMSQTPPHGRRCRS